MGAGARRSVLVTTLLGVLNGNNAGYRKLPRQFWPGLAVPHASDVSGRRHGDGSPFSWCRVGHRPITILARYYKSDEVEQESDHRDRLKIRAGSTLVHRPGLLRK